MKGQSDNKDLKKKFEDYTYPVDEANWDAISSRIYAGSGDGFLGSKFAGYSAQPSPEVWSGIEAAIHPSRKKRPVAYWWYGVAAGLLLFIYLGYENYDPRINDKPIAQKAPINEGETDTAGLSESDQNKAKQTLIDTVTQESETSAEANTPKGNSKTASKSENGVMPATDKDASPPAQGEPGTELNREGDNHTAIAEAESDESTDENVDKPSAPATSESNLPTKLALRNPGVQGYRVDALLAVEERELPLAEESSDDETKSTGFYNGLESPSSPDISLWAGSQLAFGNAEGENHSGSFLFEGIGAGTSLSTADVVDRSFAMPIYYGINGEIAFWKRMAAGVGVGYLQMQTTTTYAAPNGKRVEEENRNYLSIPLYLKLNFVHKPKFSAYTSLGHSFDLLVGQNVKSEFHQNGQVTQLNSPVQEQRKGNQANVYSSLGMHFKFTKNLGVFGEGTLMHYYELNHRNFYSQQKLWPGLKFGLLVSFE